MGKLSCNKSKNENSETPSFKFYDDTAPYFNLFVCAPNNDISFSSKEEPLSRLQVLLLENIDNIDNLVAIKSFKLFCEVVAFKKEANGETLKGLNNGSRALVIEGYSFRFVYIENMNNFCKDIS